MPSIVVSPVGAGVPAGRKAGSTGADKDHVGQRRGPEVDEDAATRLRVDRAAAHRRRSDQPPTAFTCPPSGAHQYPSLRRRRIGPRPRLGVDGDVAIRPATRGRSTACRDGSRSARPAPAAAGGVDGGERLGPVGRRRAAPARPPPRGRLSTSFHRRVQDAPVDARRAAPHPRRRGRQPRPAWRGGAPPRQRGISLSASSLAAQLSSPLAGHAVDPSSSGATRIHPSWTSCGSWAGRRSSSTRPGSGRSRQASVPSAG